MMIDTAPPLAAPPPGIEAAAAVDGRIDDDQDADVASDTPASSAHRSNQLILSYQGEVYVFDSIPPEEVQAMLLSLGRREMTTGAQSQSSRQLDKPSDVPHRVGSLMRFKEKRKELNSDARIRYAVGTEVELRMERGKAQFKSSKSNPEDVFLGVTNCHASRCWSPADGRLSATSDCHHCGISSQSSLMMCHGPNGPRTLCNTCGLMWANKIPTECTSLPRNRRSISQDARKQREAEKKEARGIGVTPKRPRDAEKKEAARGVEVTPKQQREAEEKEEAHGIEVTPKRHREAEEKEAARGIEIPTEGTSLPRNQQSNSQHARRQREAEEKDGWGIEDIHPIPVTWSEQMVNPQVTSFVENRRATPSKLEIAQRARRQQDAEEKAARVIMTTPIRQRKLKGNQETWEFEVSPIGDVSPNAITWSKQIVTQRGTISGGNGGSTPSKLALAQRARRQREAEQKAAQLLMATPVHHRKMDKNVEVWEFGVTPTSDVCSNPVTWSKHIVDQRVTSFDGNGGSAPSKLAISQHARREREVAEKAARVIMVTPIRQRKMNENEEACGFEVIATDNARPNPITWSKEMVSQMVTSTEGNGGSAPSKLAISQRARRQREAEEKAARVMVINENGEAVPSKQVISQRARRKREAEDKAARGIVVNENGEAVPSKQAISQRARRQREAEEKAARGIVATPLKRRKMEEKGAAWGIEGAPRELSKTPPASVPNVFHTSLNDMPRELLKTPPASVPNVFHTSLNDMPRELSKTPSAPVPNVFGISLNNVPRNVGGAPRELSKTPPASVPNVFYTSLNDVPRELSKTPPAPVPNVFHTSLNDVPREIAKTPSAPVPNVFGISLNDVPRNVGNPSNSMAGHQPSVPAAS